MLSHREILLQLCRLRHRAQIYGVNDKEKNLRTPKREHHQYWRHTLPLRESVVPDNLTLTSARICIANVVLSSGTTIFPGIDHDTELRSIGKEKTCELPDRNIITVGARRFHCASVSFQHVSLLTCLRVPRHFFTMKCDVDIRNYLFVISMMSFFPEST